MKDKSSILFFMRLFKKIFSSNFDFLTKFLFRKKTCFFFNNKIIPRNLEELLGFGSPDDHNRHEYNTFHLVKTKKS